MINSTSAILIDSLNRIWVATTRGISMIQANRNTITNFTSGDGLPTVAFNEQTGYVTRAGEFILPSANSFVKFNPLNFQNSPRSLPFYISAVNVLNRRLELPKEVNAIDTLHLKAAENTFTVDMVALDFEKPGHIWYAFMLEGYDRDWTVGHHHQAHYTKVPGGNYTFRYKALTNPDDRTLPEKRLTILVDAPFYKKWLFQVSLLILTGTLLLAFHRYRLRQEHKVIYLQSRSQLLEKEKALIMYENLKQQLNPHFLFNSLNSLRSLISDSPEKANTFLDGLSRIYRYILQNQDTETLPLYKEIQFTQTYIDLQLTRFTRGLIVNINIPESYLGHKIVPVTLQNLVENAIKHNSFDQDAPLVIDIYTEANYLIVRNNLQPKEFVESSNGQGLARLRTVYTYLTDNPLIVNQVENSFYVKIPLLT